MDEESYKFTVKIPTKHLSIDKEDKSNDKSEQIDKSDKNDKNDKSEKKDKNDKYDKNDRYDKNDKTERSSRREHNHHHRRDDKLSEKDDEKRKWKSKFEQIQTQLSRTEIQMYDYKLKLNDLMKENLNLKETLETKIQQLEDKLECKCKEYRNLNDEYNQLKCRLTAKSIDLIDLNDSSIGNSLTNHHSNSDNLAELLETNRQLREQNEQLRKEIKNLENELEESSDRYREDQTNEYKETKFNLEVSIKNARLLQFKLTKLERAYNQLKVEHHHLANKFKKATELNNLRNRPLTPQTEITKTELDKAKEVLLRMHISLQTLKGEKKQLEDQLNLTKSELLSISLRNQQQMKPNRALSPQTSIDKHLEETIRDLEERESDLTEQLKFSEQESESLRKKLSIIENENEILTKQIQQLSDSLSNTGIKDENSIEKIVVLKVEQDEQMMQLKKELNEQKKLNLELEMKLNQLEKSNELKDDKFIRRGSGELIRKDSGGILRKDSSGSDYRRNSSTDKKEEIRNEDDEANRMKSISNSSLNNPKVEKVLQKENLKSGSLFYEEKIENLERQLSKVKGDLNDKQQENEDLMNLIDLKRKDKFGKRLIRSSSLQD